MKRYRRPVFIGMIAVLIVYFTIPLLWHKGQAWVKRYQMEGIQKISDSVSSSLVYPVKPGQWLSFNIPEGSQQLRVISNAHIQKPDKISAEDNWRYILRYQLIDKNGKVILDEPYHLRSKLSAYRDQQGIVNFGNFYSGYPLSPLDGRLMLLSMTTIQQAVSVRISFVQQSPELKEAAIRLYVPAKTVESRLTAMWLRMNKKSKENLAKNTSYPAALLTATEKSNLLKHQWQAQGPTGIEGIDYIPRTLYALRDVREQEKIGELIIAAGLQVDAEHLGIIPIPEQGGELTIQLSQLDGSPVNTSVALQLNWFGRTREQRWQREAQWLPETEQLSYTVEGGLLQINAPESIVVHAFLNLESETPVDITPKPLNIKTYVASYGVDYQILHVDNQPAPMRVDIRRIYDGDTTDTPAQLHYQWLNSQQHVIDSGTLTIQHSPSVYDRLTGQYKELTVSDPVRYYFNVPADVSQVRLTAEQANVLVNVYNQPNQYRKMQRVPENAYISVDKENWFPSWFQMRPENDSTLIKQQAVRIVAAQYRPPEDDPDLLSTQYLWENFLPLEQTEARFILTKMDSLDYRDEALASVYCQIQPNQRNHLTFKAFGNLPQISPELIYIRPHKSAFNVAVSIDREQVLAMPAIGQQGIFKLPTLGNGNHTVKVTTQGGGGWYMNYVSGCKSSVFLKRRVYKLTNQQLTFSYSNLQLEDKVFSGRFYTQANSTQRSVIEVSIEPLQKQLPHKRQEDWTFTRRSYDIRPAQQQPSVVLHSHGHFLNSGESFFIAFNRDMPKGRYQIKIKLKQGTSGYMGLSLIKPGVYEQLRFYRETNDQIH